MYHGRRNKEMIIKFRFYTPKWKVVLIKPNCKWEDDNTNYRYTGYKGVHWTELPENWIQ
jgi:hypothetical protein